MSLGAQNQTKKTIFDYVLKERNYFKGLEKAKALLASQGCTDKQFTGLVNDVHSFLRNHRQLLLLYGVLNSSPVNEEYCSPTTMGLLMFNSNFNELILLMEIQKLKQVSRNPLVYYTECFNRPRDRQFNINAPYEEILKNFNIRMHPYVFYLKYLNENNVISLEDYRYLLGRTNDNNDDESCLKKFNSTIEEIKKTVIKKDKIYISPGINNNRGEPIPAEDFSKESKKYFSGIAKFSGDYNKNIFMFAEIVNKTTIQITNKEKAALVRDMYVDLTMYLDLKYENLYKDVLKDQKIKYECQSKHQKFDKTNVEHIRILEEWINYYNSSDNELLRKLLCHLIKTLKLSYEEIYCNFPNLLKNCFGISKKKNLYEQLIGASAPTVKESYLIPGKITLEMLINESKKYEYIFNDFSLPRIRNGKLVDLYKEYLRQNHHGKYFCECCGKEFSVGSGVGAVHHIIPFNEDSALGPDNYLNLVFVCDNCHKSFHNSKNKKIIENFIEGINKNNILKKSINDRILELDSQGVLYQSCKDYAKRKNLSK